MILETWAFICLLVWLIPGVLAAAMIYQEHGAPLSGEEALEVAAGFFWPVTLALAAIVAIGVAGRSSLENVRKNVETA